MYDLRLLQFKFLDNELSNNFLIYIIVTRTLRFAIFLLAMFKLRCRGGDLKYMLKYYTILLLFDDTIMIRIS